MNDEFLQQLETEIENYDKNLQLNDNENILRYWIIIRLKQLLHTKFTDFRIDIFGSFGTGCSLSDGDLDLSIHIEDTQQIDLGYIRSLCFRAYWIDVDTIEYISHTRVPVLKFKTTAWAGCISVDIVINRVSGLDSSCCVIDWFKRYSFLKPLVLVLKQYLKINHLDVVYNGGLGGFALINMLMVLVHLESDPNLGFPKARYLLKFFHFYGNFNYDDYGITVSSIPIIKKPSNWKIKPTFYIQDPTDPDNNISKSTFRFPELKMLFNMTCKAFKHVFTKWETQNQLKQQPILFQTLSFGYNVNVDIRNRITESLDNIRRICTGLHLSITSHHDQQLLDMFLKPTRNLYLDSNIYNIDDGYSSYRTQSEKHSINTDSESIQSHSNTHSSISSYRSTSSVSRHTSSPYSSRSSSSNLDHQSQSISTYQQLKLNLKRKPVVVVQSDDDSDDQIAQLHKRSKPF